MEQKVNWHDFWARQQNPGFHEASVNHYLEAYLPGFQLQSGDTVFLPLCGKAVDMLWLQQQGFQVIGVELSEVAVRAFFDESGLDYEVEKLGELTLYRGEGISLYQGNFIHLNAAQLSACKLVYDRAAIVAIEGENRQLYSQRMLKIIPPDIPMLVIALRYDQDRMQGPPFSVPNHEIEDLYGAHFRVRVLEDQERIEAEPRWRGKGLDSFRESALRLDRL